MQTFDTLYRDHHGWLRSLLRKKLGNIADAADLAHDTYLRILISGQTPQTPHARRYLARIANCLVIDLYRRRAIETAYLDAISQLPAHQAPSEEARAIVIETLTEMDAMLDALPSKVRATLVLCKVHGLTYPQIASRLGVSLSSVEKYMATALAACHQAIHQLD